MTKLVADAVLDSALNYIKNNATKLHVCSTAPANYAGIAAVQLASVVIDSSDFTGPADGDTNGRKIAVNAQTGMEVTASGTAAHIALSNGTDTLYYVTEIEPDTSLTDNDSNTCSTDAWDIEIADPT